MSRRPSLIALKMEAASTCAASENFYQTTRHNNPEDSDLHTGRRENLKRHVFVFTENGVLV
jgi:hypothetical protein